MNEPKIKPTSKRRHIEREYTSALILIRQIFDIPTDELIDDLIYDQPNSRIIIKTMKDFDEKMGDL